MDGDKIAESVDWSDSKWQRSCCPWVSCGKRRGWIEGGKFCLKLSFQGNAVFGNDKVQHVSKSEIEGVTEIESNGGIKKLRGQVDNGSLLRMLKLHGMTRVDVRKRQ